MVSGPARLFAAVIASRSDRFPSAGSIASSVVVTLNVAGTARSSRRSSRGRKPNGRPVIEEPRNEWDRLYLERTDVHDRAAVAIAVLDPREARAPLVGRRQVAVLAPVDRPAAGQKRVR